MTAAHRRRACSPGDIDGGDDIRMVLEAARSATKGALDQPVLPVDVPAPRALPGGVVGVDVENRDASGQGFVPQECLELAEGPGVEIGPELLSGSYPLPDMREVFEHQHITWIKRLHDALGQGVVNVAHPPSLLAGQPSQGALGAFRALPLERLTETTKMLAASQNSPAGEHKTVRGGGQVLKTPVHPDEPGSLGLRHRRGNHDVDGELALSLRVHQRGRGRVLPDQKVPLVLADPHRKNQPTRMGRDGDGLLFRDPAKGALVQAHAGRTERQPPLGIGLHSFADPGNSPDHQVGLQPVPGLDGPVAEVLNGHLVGGLVLHGQPVGILADSSEAGHRLVEDEGLLRIDF